MSVTIYKLDTIINFGNKHRGKTLRHVISVDASYVIWAIDTISWFDIDAEAEEFLNDTL